MVALVMVWRIGLDLDLLLNMDNHHAIPTNLVPIRCDRMCRMYRIIRNTITKVSLISALLISLLGDCRESNVK